MRLTAKSFVLDLLSTLGGRSMPVRGLVAAAGLFGIEANSLRVALARLLAAGTLERDERGEYRLGERAQAVQHHVVSWRRLEERIRQWPGGWIAIHTSILGRADARRCERAFRFFGFRELSAGLEVRPDNLVIALSDLHRELVSLGLPRRAPVFTIAELDEASQARAAGSWNVRKLVAEYHRSIGALEASAVRLPKLAPGEAMVESFVLGGRVIRQLVLDPLLPESIVDAAERRALVAAMRRYDKLGHACWRPFFSEYRVTSLRAPVDSNAESTDRAA
ncbi:MAG TPA: PaaX family transcriptional regulator [Candidatus Binatia bacterium]|nr:PaaX family transcriptional regulator [Candidatus Binatia bacterium]